MKWTFQLALYERALKDDRLFLIYGDVGAALFKKFRHDFPKRCFNAGICEQAMVSMAAGMAMEGYRPVLYTITPFLLERAFEQIKLDVIEQDLPVGMVGYSDYSAGPTHREVDAFRMMRLFKYSGPRHAGIQCLFPSTDFAVTACVADVNLDEPWFMFLEPPIPQ